MYFIDFATAFDSVNIAAFAIGTVKYELFLSVKGNFSTSFELWNRLGYGHRLLVFRSFTFRSFQSIELQIFVWFFAGRDDEL